ncbi:hypothetical protein [Streptomyces hilarionis]|uniref:hypothetical protein n=1 Tax=Streptomyces hilarionis TaxID=2839954 RepID=UPI00211A913E|nr:hypothetical protein [Streptomyces hilarionis]MCQ9134723.1 hypothetical protein [Streptomyces hilarionis]
MRKSAWPSGAAHSPITPRGTAEANGTGVEHRITETLLREFLTLLEEIQRELNSRWNGQDASDRHATCA